MHNRIRIHTVLRSRVDVFEGIGNSGPTAIFKLVESNLLQSLKD